MRRGTALVVTTVAAAGAMAAIPLPWAVYGQSHFELTAFPNWYVYPAVAAAQQLYTGWAVATGANRRRVVVAVDSALAAATIGVVIVFMQRYDNASDLFGPSGVIPMVLPNRGPGGFVAVAAALTAWLAIVRRADITENVVTAPVTRQPTSPA